MAGFFSMLHLIQLLKALGTTHSSLSVSYDLRVLGPQGSHKDGDRPQKSNTQEANFIPGKKLKK